MSGAPDPDEPSSPRRVREGDRTRIGRYRLAYELASGGMATVFLARIEGTAGFDKIVALKRIHRHLLEEPRYVRMFLDEARIASRIDHPNVASVIDFGDQDGDYYLVMEFLLGVPLSRLISTLARSPKARPERWPAIASRLIAEACEGLHAAHELRDGRGELLGVVHRDVSPQNLFVGFDGVVRVVDFGVAQAAGKLHQTVSGEIKGKIAYMSPEQLRGTDIDRRADVWALGVVLWEMLTFRRLFRRASEVDAMYGVLEGEVPPPSQLAKGLPGTLEAAVLRALDRDLDRRWPTARGLGRRLVEVWGAELERPVDAAEVAQLLHEVFPGEEERQRALVELARQDPGDIPKVAINPSEESFSGVRDEPIAEPRPTAKASRARWLLVAAAVGMGLLAGAGAMLALAGDPEPEAPLAATEPAAPDPAPPDRPAVDPPAAPPEPAPAVPEPPPEPVAAEPEPEVARPGGRRRVRRSAPEAPAGSTGPSAPEPPAVPPSAPGHLVVVVPGGWANVYDDGGRFLGATPLRHEVPPGRHRVQLRFYGEPPPVDADVVVEPGGVGRIVRRAPER